MKNIFVNVLIIACSFGFMAPAFSQGPGTLDPGFANGGELADPLIFPFRYSGLALSPGGEFVVSSASGDTIQAIRYTSNGSHDINFGLNTTGYVKHVFPGFSGTVTTSFVQTDQKILIAGQYAITGANKKAYLLRLKEDGQIDSSFGTNGWFFFNFFPHFGEVVRQLALQSNGNIVVLDIENYTGVTDTFVITRLKSNGTYDSSFALNGAYKVPFYNLLATSATSFTLDRNNNFTCAAYSNYNAGDYFYLFRLTANGVPDTTYGKGGSIFIDSTNIINGKANLGLNFQNDGKLITVQSKQTGDLLWAVCRYNTDGSADQGFGTNGLVEVRPNLDPVPYCVQNIVSTASGQIITAGIVSIAGANRLIVNKFNSDGSTDMTFGNNQGSELLNAFAMDDITYNLLIEPDNKILINGLVNELQYHRYEVVRLTGAGSTSVEQLSNDIDISVYPNPTTAQVSFELSEPAAGKMTLRDMNGNTVMAKETGRALIQTFDISRLAAGVYVLTWLNNENTISKMIIKQ